MLFSFLRHRNLTPALIAFLFFLPACASSPRPAAVREDRPPAHSIDLGAASRRAPAGGATFARRILVEARRLVAEARTQGSQRLVPEALADAEQALREADWLISQNPDDDAVVRPAAERASLLAQELSRQVREANAKAISASAAGEPGSTASWKAGLKRNLGALLSLLGILVGFGLGYGLGRRRARRPPPRPVPVPHAPPQERAA